MPTCARRVTRCPGPASVPYPMPAQASHDDDVPVLIAGGSLVGLSTALFLGSSRRSRPRRRAPPRHRHPPPGGDVQPAHDRALPRRRPGGGDRRGVRPGVRAERRHRLRRGACRSGARVLLPQRQRGLREPEPVAAAVRHADRPRADPPRPSRGARRPDRVGDGARRARARRRRSHRPLRERDDGSERKVRARYVVAADGSRSPIRECLGISLLGHPSFSNSITIYFRADVQPADRRPQPQRDLRLRPAPPGVLPLLARRRRRLPRRQHDRRAGRVRGTGMSGPT